MTIKGAGQLREKITFQRRLETVDPDDATDKYGNARGPWETVFSCRARLQPRLGSETVIAARMQGLQPYVMTVRSAVSTRLITPAWRAFDARAGYLADGITPKRLFDITTVANVDERGMFLDLLVTEGA